MRSIELDPVVLADLPDIDLVRPAACPRCTHPARVGGRLRLYGHGPRWRSVVIPGPALGRCRLVSCWVRRFLCRVCHKTCSVLLDGVLLSFTYSVAYASQGVDRLALEAHRSGRRRWRAPKRWADRPLTDQPRTSWQQRMQAFLIDHALRGAAV